MSKRRTTSKTSALAALVNHVESAVRRLIVGEQVSRFNGLRLGAIEDRLALLDGGADAVAARAASYGTLRDELGSEPQFRLGGK